MLGKTANGVFWMYRYLERAENVARLIETGQRIALTRSGSSEQEWISVLQTSGAFQGYEAAHDTVRKDAAVDWLLRSPDNPGSVRSCIEAARQNARLVRTALTAEVWEATNAAHIRSKSLLARKVGEQDLPSVLDSVRQATALVRGTTHGTMLRNDIFDFARLGTFLERADSTARILDVKYYVLLPSVRAVGKVLDNVQWESILRSVSARGGFRMEYGSTAGPREITEFLILDGRLPRSLSYCSRKICDNLGYLADDYGWRAPALAKAEALRNDYLQCDVDWIFDYGLHEYLQKVMMLLSDLGSQIEIDYRFYA